MSLIVFGWSKAFYQAAGTSQKVQNTLANSSFYTDFSRDLIARVQAHANNRRQNRAFSSKALGVIARAALTPSFVQSIGEKALTTTYLWLHSPTPGILTIDLTDVKSNITVATDNYVVNRLKSLPLCTVSQLRAIQVAGFDPLTAVCQPANIDLDSVKKAVEDYVNSRQSFLTGTVLTNSQLELSANNPKLSRIPRIFQMITRAPLMSALLALLSLVGIFILGGVQKGIRRVAFILIIAGTTLLIGAWLMVGGLNWLLHTASYSKDTITNNYQQSAKTLIGALSGKFLKTSMLIAVFCLIIGVITLFVSKYVAIVNKRRYMQ